MRFLVRIQIFYFVLLYYNKDGIKSSHQNDEGDIVAADDVTGEKLPFYRDIQAFEFLFEDYAPDCWYWELVETGRRLLLTAVLTVLSEDSAVQVRMI